MLLTNENGMIYLEGKETYVWREHLKHLGFVYNKTLSKWIFENPNNDQQLLQYIYNFLVLNDILVKTGNGVSTKIKSFSEQELQEQKKQLKQKGYWGNKNKIMNNEKNTIVILRGNDKETFKMKYENKTPIYIILK